MWKPITDRMATYDPGNEYAVDYMWGTDGLGYNVDKIKAIMPDAPVDSWDMLFKPEIVSKFKDCGVYVLDTPRTSSRRRSTISASSRIRRTRPTSRRPATS